jgi:hypothetical protein
MWSEPGTMSSRRWQSWASLADQLVGMRMRHHVVAGRAQHIGRRLQGGRVLDRLEAVAQHVLDRHHAELALGDRQDRIVGRDQHHRMRGRSFATCTATPEPRLRPTTAMRLRIDVGARPSSRTACSRLRPCGSRPDRRANRRSRGNSRPAPPCRGTACRRRAPPRTLPRNGRQNRRRPGAARHLRRHQPARQTGAILGAHHDRPGTVAGTVRLEDLALAAQWIEQQPFLVGRHCCGQSHPQHADDAGQTCDFFGMIHNATLLFVSCPRPHKMAAGVVKTTHRGCRALSQDGTQPRYNLRFAFLIPS